MNWLRLYVNISIPFMLIIDQFTVFAQINYENSGGYLLNSPSPLLIPTYEYSNQVTHPDILYFQDSFHGFKYWLTVTPYPYSNYNFENPSILVSNNSFLWKTLPGYSNPVVRKIKNYYHCDPDLIYIRQSQEIHLYYLQNSIETNPRLGSVNVVKSGDGRTRSKPQKIIHFENSDILSPAVLYQDSLYKMWTINAGKDGCVSQSNILQVRKSYDGTEWNEPENCNIRQPGYNVWHIDIIYVNKYNEYWMLFSAYKKGESADRGELFFSRSRNGYEWETFDRALLSNGGTWDNRCIYRSTFFYHEKADLLRIYYSAMNKEGVWKIGSIDVKYGNLCAILENKDLRKKFATCTIIQNYPNPFNCETILNVILAKPGITSVHIFNPLGQLIKILINKKNLNAGEYQIKWDGRDRYGIQVAGGLYFCRLKTGNFHQTIKLTFLQ